MKIEEEIIKILTNEPNLTAREIAKKISDKTQSKQDKTSINKYLYGALRSQLNVDNKYRWSIGSAKIVQNINESNIKDTLLTKLSSYYLECLAKDMESGVWCYASNKFGAPDYGQIYSLPQISENNDSEIFESESVKKVINKVRREKNNLTLQLGYPINLRKVTTKTNEFFVVEPIFLFPFETETFQYSYSPRLKPEMPSFNVEAIKHLSGLDKNELFEEIIILNEELGLNNALDYQPDLDDLFYKLQELRPQWNWLESIDVEKLTVKKLDEATKIGIHNSAAVFSTERSRYTVGLEKELTDFRFFEPNQYSNSILSKFLTQEFDSFEFEDLPLVEPIPLNDEQRSAVNLALQSPLTVITGPPGTGKSQVVTSIIINAIYNGQTVLFSSKNHKAVDVVYERINGLASRAVMLRLGNTEMQSELAKYLSGLITETTTADEIDRLEYCTQKRNELILKNKQLKEKEKKLISLRNETDALEQKINHYRELFGDNIYIELKQQEIQYLEEINEALILLQKSLDALNKSIQPMMSKLLWPFSKGSRLTSAITVWKQKTYLFERLKIEIPNQDITFKNINNFQTALNNLKNLADFSEVVKKYFQNLNELKNIPSTFKLANDSHQIDELISENSIELWESWLKALPSRLTDENRKILSEYNTLLNLLTKAVADKTNPDKKTYARYYSLIPKIANILPCWAVTSLSVKGKVPFESGFFDLVIIDEASQCDISSALPLLYRAKRAVIIGDNKQLSHISMISESQDMQLLEKYQLDKDHLVWSFVGNSLFGLSHSICNQSHLVTLKDHHRSHASIINFSNNEFYDGSLRVATKYSNLKSIHDEPAIRWVNAVGEVITPNVGGAYNEIEANAVVSELKRLISTGYQGTIGVVSPFRAQANKINELILSDLQLIEKLTAHNILVDTVHKFQGDERDLMIFSPVISKGLKAGPRIFLTRTGNLFNVAITRARAVLVVVGDYSACNTSEISYMEKFTRYVNDLNNQSNHNNDSNLTLTSTYPKFNSDVYISDWEKILYEALYKAGVKTIPQFKVDQYSLDLALIQGTRKLDIEVDGEKYHRNWDGELFKRDKLRNKRLIELGWDVQRFWVYEIKDDLEGSVKRVLDWVNNV
jgi:very-short-patch-repair endonuclease